MTVLFVGLLLFVAVHVVPTAPPLRQKLVDRLGLWRYRGVYSLVALVGLALIIYGKWTAEHVPVYLPPEWGRGVALVSMPLFSLFFLAAYLPGHLRRVLRHPMLLGMVVWGVAHLLSNGDLSSIALFGAFALLGVYGLASHLWRPSTKEPAKPARVWADALALAVTPLSYGTLVYLHHLSGRVIWW